MRKILKFLFEKDERGESYAMLLAVAIFGFGSILAMPWIFYLFR